MMLAPKDVNIFCLAALTVYCSFELTYAYRVTSELLQKQQKQKQADKQDRWFFGDLGKADTEHYFFDDYDDYDDEDDEYYEEPPTKSPATPITEAEANEFVDLGLMKKGQVGIAISLANVVPGFVDALKGCLKLPVSVEKREENLAKVLEEQGDREVATLDKADQDGEEEDDDVFFDAPEIPSEEQGKEGDDDVFFDALEYPSESSMLQTAGATNASKNQRASASARSCQSLASGKDGVDVVLGIGKMAAEGFIHAEDFSKEVGSTSAMTVCKRDELTTLVSMSDYLQGAAECDGVEDVSECLEKVAGPPPLEKQASFRKEYEDMQAKQCECPNGPLVTEEMLQHIISVDKIKRGPFMMREAAWKYCERRGLEKGQVLVATYTAQCPAKTRGYCCTVFVEPGNRPQTSQITALQHKKRRLMLKSLTMVGRQIQTVLNGIEDVFSQVRRVTEAKHVRRRHKVMLYKMYAIHYHHSQLILKKHAYCIRKPDDMSACEDPMFAGPVYKSVVRMLEATREEIRIMASCMMNGVLPLDVVRRNADGVLNKVVAMIVNVVGRSVYFVSSGQLARAVHKMGYKMTATVWRYRTEILMSTVVIAGSLPIMKALVTTGITTGSASSISLVFDQLLRNVMVHLACPILKTPLFMSMMIRWSMKTFLLSDTFIEHVIKPLWTFIKVSNPLLWAGELGGTAVEKVVTMLRWISNKLQGADGDAILNQRQTWLEAARKFHNHPVADFLYGFFAVTFGGFWRSIAGPLCAGLETATVVANGAESVVEATTGAYSKGFNWVARTFSAAGKSLVGDAASAKAVSKMAAANAAAAAGSGEALVKGLSAAHLALSKLVGVHLKMMNVGLTSIIAVLNNVGELAGFSYLMSLFMGHFMFPKFQKDVNVNVIGDNVLQVAQEDSRMDFNKNSCEGKKLWSKCLYLNNPTLDSEEAILGVCCNKVCQPEGETCPALSEEEQRALDEYDPEAVPITNMKEQSQYLGDLVKMGREAYTGGFCKV
eukprot:TRINITY_DN6505_c0_g1_i1.p1 TRINITY_DN6505_c0_g1~~TRINITY_DN6505_c0_g1_i1.p1  ORF type:complete len:1001 (-),score=219.43 TRINITY_DN6505_c0_g1_i1:170-3172(-)